MGAKRKPEAEKVQTITINLQQKIIDRIEQDGNPKHVIEKLIQEKYAEK